VNVSGVSFSEGEGGEVVVKLATNGPPKFKAFMLKAPDRLVVDVLDGTGTLNPVTGNLKVGKAGVKTVRYSQFQASVFRTVIDLEAAKKYRVEAWPEELRIFVTP
jgi:hypothetical protein